MSLVKCGIDLSSVKFKTADINLTRHRNRKDSAKRLIKSPFLAKF
ncbi:hypothetical protein [Campylobacter rectus]|nr:hypothetical protein [Campylobacter rectus]